MGIQYVSHWKKLFSVGIRNLSLGKGKQGEVGPVGEVGQREPGFTPLESELPASR